MATGLSYPAPCPKMARGHTAATPSLLLWLMLPPPPPLSSFPLIFVLSPSCFSSLYYFFPISDFVSLLRSPPPPPAPSCISVVPPPGPPSGVTLGLVRAVASVPSASLHTNLISVLSLSLTGRIPARCFPGVKNTPPSGARPRKAPPAFLGVKQVSAADFSRPRIVSLDGSLVKQGV